MRTLAILALVALASPALAAPEPDPPDPVSQSQIEPGTDVRLTMDKVTEAHLPAISAALGFDQIDLDGPALAITPIDGQIFVPSDQLVVHRPEERPGIGVSMPCERPLDPVAHPPSVAGLGASSADMLRRLTVHKRTTWLADAVPIDPGRFVAALQARLGYDSPHAIRYGGSPAPG